MEYSGGSRPPDSHFVDPGEDLEARLGGDGNEVAELRLRRHRVPRSSLDHRQLVDPPIGQTHAKLSPLPRTTDAAVSSGLRRVTDDAEEAAHHDRLVWKPPPRLHSSSSSASSSSSSSSSQNSGDAHSPSEGALLAWWRSWLEFWLWRDVRRHPGYYFTCLTVAASQGFSESFAALAVSYYYKDTLGKSPSEVQAASSLMVLAWMVKPLFGFVSDSFPVFGYRRKPYLFAMGILGSLCWFAMATVVEGFGASIGVLFLFQLSMAFINTLAKALIVEQANAYSQRVQRRHEREARRQRHFNRAPGDGEDQELFEEPDDRDDEVGGDAEDEDEDGVLPVDARTYTSFQISMFAGTLHAVSVISGYIGGALLEWGVAKRTVMGCSGILPLLCAVAGLFLAEEVWPAELRVSVRAQVRRLWLALQSRPARPTPENLNRLPVWQPAVFILLWMATPTSGAAMFSFFSNDLRFGPETIARIQLLGSLCGLGGIFVYQTWFAGVRYRRLLLATCLVGVAASLLPVVVATHYNRRLGIPDVAFCIADTALISAVGEIALMPLLTLAATISEAQGVEGSLYACLMSLANIGSALSELLGAGVMRLLGVGATSFGNLWLLLVICSFSSLLPLPLLWVLVPEQAESETEFFARGAAGGEAGAESEGERRGLLAGMANRGGRSLGDGGHGEDEGDGSGSDLRDGRRGFRNKNDGRDESKQPPVPLRSDSTDSAMALFPLGFDSSGKGTCSALDESLGDGESFHHGEDEDGAEELPDGPHVMLAHGYRFGSEDGGADAAQTQGPFGWH